MKQWIRESERARAAYWNGRQLLSLKPKTAHEILHRFRRHADRTGWEKPGAFEFPWGIFEYYSAGKLLIQFEEIFQKRHYAFKADKADPIIVDCGGNCGLSAVWFKLNYPGCHLTVFEPDENLALLIERNLRHGGFDNFECKRQAAWVQDGKVGFDLRGDDQGRISADAGQRVEAVDLARSLPALVDLLKLDIEGAEFEVMAHLCETGAIRQVKNLVCELHVRRSEEAPFIRILQQLKDSGLHLSLNYGLAVSGIGLADEESPFEVIGRNHFLVELYAWWPERKWLVESEVCEPGKS